ncbi:hypothetical protein R4B61_00375 [Fructilactobacillus vespulae]|uniref:hypothetical protein n=1 Tax=Fructilactobacillus vespulae TaxID=1249630 RepID=UPI0039B4540C
MVAINYVTKDNGALDQKITQGLLTSALGGNADVELVNGGKSFTLTTISTSGLKAHSRGKGYNSGSVENAKEVYTMGQDRDVEFFVDKQDVDETNQDLAAANISKVFIEEHVQPEIDAYRFSKLAKKAVEANQSNSDSITKANVYSKIKDAILPVRKYGPQNIVVFVSSETMDALEQSTEFTRSITNQNIGMTALESRVTSIDGVQLVEVWDEDRFMSDYDFSDGFKATSDAVKINFLVVANPAIIQLVKENAVYLFEPGQHTEGDGYLYQNRLYHDIFVRKNKLDGIRVSLTKPTATK